MRHYAYLAALVSAIGSGTLVAEVKLPAILSDHMVLQASKPVPIWGTAAAGEKVSVTFSGQSLDATADAQGQWRVNLAALKPAAAGELTVAGTNTLKIKNVLVGEVWLASGQSNMNFQLKQANNAETEIPAATFPAIRVFHVEKIPSLTPGVDVQGKWVECNPQNAEEFSAVGYFFSKEIHQKTGFPVGLIQSTWGGTPAQSWTSFEGLKKEPALAHYVQDVEGYLLHPESIQTKLESDLKAWEKAMARYEKNLKKDTAYQESLEAWEKAVTQAKAQHTARPHKPQPPHKAPLKRLAVDKTPSTPSSLFTGMIQPLIPYAIQGVIWYQGEANADKAVEYRTLFPRMITDWREHWAQKGGAGDFPFYWVSLANLRAREAMPTDQDWAWLREAQSMTLKLPNTGQALAMDIGQADNIHPKDKLDVGLRLARLALKNQYGQKIVAVGPTYKEMKIEGSKACIRFGEIGSGLTIAAAPSTQPGVSAEKPAAEVVGFAIAGEDKKFVWAKATIEGDSVVVWSDQVAKPVAVRYAWANNPACNLYNQEGLPAVAFRTDDWPQEK